MKPLVFAMSTAAYSGRSHEIKATEVLAEKCDEVILVTEQGVHYSPNSVRPKNMHVLNMPVNRPLSADLLLTLTRLDFDVIFCTSMSGAENATTLRNMLPHRPKVVVQVLDIPMWRLRFEEWTARYDQWFRALAKADRLIANTERTRQDLLTVLGTKREVDLVFYGMDSEASDAVPNQEVRDEITFCSRLVFYKGASLAMAAVSLIEEEVQPVLKIIGTGEEEFTLRQMEHFMPLKVRFLGGISDEEKFTEIKRSMMGLSTDFNLWISNMTTMETLYSGRPCIAHHMPINHERFHEWPEYVNVMDTQAVAEKIMIIKNNLDHYLEKARHAREWLAKNRTFRTHAEGIYRVLREAVGE